ncbi:MAG: STAS domain-containing protein [Lachnospiraceae bacterium]|nr:STAS domain-containing protein [Lachnospiraceae bacterium]
MLKIDHREKNGDCRMTLTGQLDSTTAVELDNTLQLILPKTESLTIDCTRLAYVSSAGLRVLLSTSKTLSARKGLVLTDLTDPVKHILEVTGMTGFFTIR